jgi:hypothetical protein
VPPNQRQQAGQPRLRRAADDTCLRPVDWAFRISEAIQIINDEAGDGRRPRALGQLLVNIAGKDLDFAPLEAGFWLYAVRHREAMKELAPPRPQHDALRPVIENALRLRGRDQLAGIRR